MTTRTLNGTRVRPTLMLREPPVGHRDFVQLRADDGAQVFIHRRVLRDADSLTRVNIPDETGALLMGATFTDGRHPFTIVTDLVPPLPGEVIGTSATVTITAMGRRRMEVEGRLRDPIAAGVGWMHSHPIQPAFFSATDRDEQSKWTGPASVGLVVSGREDAVPRFRVFLGPDASEASEPGCREAASRPLRRLPRAQLEAPPGRAATGVRARRRKLVLAAAPGLLVLVAVVLIVAFVNALQPDEPAPERALPNTVTWPSPRFGGGTP